MKSPSVEVTQLPKLPARRSDAHKGDFGRILVVAGSTGMVGAGALTAMAALRSGAGLVTWFVPARTYSTAAGFSPVVMTRPSRACEDYLTPEALGELTELLSANDVVALGPGLGRRPETGEFVCQLLQRVGSAALVLDADGLYGVHGHLDLLAQRKAPQILTPHPGELSTLMGETIESIQADRHDSARRLARGSNGVAVLKGHRTVVSNGERHYVNPTGNAGMASAGSGDVLTGIVAALLAQGMEAFDAACLGTCIHGLAGDLAAEQVGEPSLVATDLIDYLPQAFLSRKQHEMG